MLAGNVATYLGGGGTGGGGDGTVVGKNVD